MSNAEGYRYLNLVGFTVDALQPLALFKDESDESTTDRVKMDWVVKAPKGTKLKITARHERAGTVKLELVLK